MAECIANTKQEMLNGFKLACTIAASDKVAFSWTCHLLNVICCKFHWMWAELGPGVSFPSNFRWLCNSFTVHSAALLYRLLDHRGGSAIPVSYVGKLWRKVTAAFSGRPVATVGISWTLALQGCLLSEHSPCLEISSFLNWMMNFGSKANI